MPSSRSRLPRPCWHHDDGDPTRRPRAQTPPLPPRTSRPPLWTLGLGLVAVHLVVTLLVRPYPALERRHLRPQRRAVVPRRATRPPRAAHRQPAAGAAVPRAVRLRPGRLLRLAVPHRRPAHRRDVRAGQRALRALGRGRRGPADGVPPGARRHRDPSRGRAHDQLAAAAGHPLGGVPDTRVRADDRGRATTLSRRRDRRRRSDVVVRPGGPVLRLGLPGARALGVRLPGHRRGPPRVAAAPAPVGAGRAADARLPGPGAGPGASRSTATRWPACTSASSTAESRGPSSPGWTPLLRLPRAIIAYPQTTVVLASIVLTVLGALLLRRRGQRADAGLVRLGVAPVDSGVGPRSTPTTSRSTPR